MRRSQRQFCIARQGKVLVIALLLLRSLGAAAQQHDEQAEQQLLRLLNDERTKAGLAALEVDDRLQSAARAHALLMVKAGELSHQFPGEPAMAKRLAAHGVRFDRSGENVAYDSSVEGAHVGLMLSPPHRANILSREYNAVGIGVVRKGQEFWVTQNFAHRLAEHSPDEAEALTADAWRQERQRAKRRAATLVGAPKIRDLACQMAERDKVDTPNAKQLPGARATVAFTGPDPGRLPAEAVTTAKDRVIASFAVGACFAATERYPSGTWWVVMVFYMNSRNQNE